jgi:hypothetical protein
LLFEEKCHVAYELALKSSTNREEIDKFSKRFFALGSANIMRIGLWSLSVPPNFTEGAQSSRCAIIDSEILVSGKIQITKRSSKDSQAVSRFTRRHLMVLACIVGSGNYFKKSPTGRLTSSSFQPSHLLSFGCMALLKRVSNGLIFSQTGMGINNSSKEEAFLAHSSRD